MNGLQVDLQKTFSIRRHRSFTVEAKFDAPAGVTVVFGPSGSGKTTILQCIAGLLRQDAGHIRIGEQTLFDAKKKIDLPVQARHVGYVFQDLALFPHMSAAENIAFGIQGENGERARQVADVLERFSISGVAARRPDEISGGERQRVALARALVTRPSLLLLDEPFSALDDELKLEIIGDLKRWLEQNRIPVLLVTHDRAEAALMGGRVLLLHEGRITGEITAEQLTARV